MSSQSDLDINRAVRRVMVKHWIDLGRISIRSSHGRLQIRGRLQRIAGREDPLTTPLVEAMFTEIGRIRGVGTVQSHIENWVKDGGRWKAFERYSATVDNTTDAIKTSAGSISLD